MGPAPAWALGRKIQARRTANRTTAANRLATVRATISTSSADGCDPVGHDQSQRRQAEAHQVQAAGHGEEATAAGLPVGGAGELPVHGRVEQRGDGHGDGVGPEGAEERPPGDEEEEVAERGDDAHPGEAQELVGRDLVRTDAAQPLGPPDQHPPDAAQVVGRRRHDLHPRIGVVDPVHRDLADAQAQALGRDQQLGVEEPLVVLDERQQLRRRVAAQGLEAALGIAEAALQRELEQQVVRPRNQLALGSADDVRTGREPRADGDVAMTGQQRRDQREQGGQRGREIDVHVGDDRRLAGRPCRAERVAPPLAGQVHGRHAAHGRGQLVRHLVGVVRAGVVDHGDERAEGERFVEERAQGGDALGQLCRLVVDRHDDLDIQRDAAGVDVGFEGGQGCHARHVAACRLRAP